MTTYLLDTNACIALINGTEPNVRRRFQRAVARESVVLLSSIVAFELWYGVAKSQRKDRNRPRLEAFLAGPLEWTMFDEDDAEAAGAVRAELEAEAYSRPATFSRSMFPPETSATTRSPGETRTLPARSAPVAAAPEAST
jgi:predicted nucleic acid-binding protein